MSDNFNPSGTGMNTEYTQGPAAGTHSEGFNQSQDMGAYDEMQRSQGGDVHRRRRLLRVVVTLLRSRTAVDFPCVSVRSCPVLLD